MGSNVWITKHSAGARCALRRGWRGGGVGLGGIGDRLGVFRRRRVAGLGRVGVCKGNRRYPRAFCLNDLRISGRAAQGLPQVLQQGGARGARVGGLDDLAPLGEGRHLGNGAQ
jgi:hypothetical protein